MKPMSLESFLKNAQIEPVEWERANIQWETLSRIADDHLAQVDRLGETAAMFANIIQKFNKVHSVRWRVKDVEHLLTKIVRKRAEGVEKYLSINDQNYHEAITDLIGIRALHLFKDDCFDIDTALRAAWTPTETAIAYIRDGDRSEFTNRLKEAGLEIRQHPAGYRSVHYVLTTKPMKRSIFVEVQVRTIFEEGWSEIDHTVRYPNFSDNELVGYFLAIFNRMAGSADEMGGFVRGLTNTLEGLEAELATAKNEKQKTVQDMENTLTQMEAVKQQDAESRRQIAALKVEVSRLKSTVVDSSIPSFLATSSPSSGGVFGGATSAQALRAGLLDSARTTDFIATARTLAAAFATADRTDKSKK